MFAYDKFKKDSNKRQPKNYREAFANADEARKLKILLDFAFDNGIMLINTGSRALSTVMTETEIDTLAQVMLDGFRKIKQG